MNKLLLTTVLAVGMASGASATTITVNGIDGNWTAASPGGVTGVGTDTISWGEPATYGGSKSSYVFTGAGTPITVAPDTVFSLGTFTHNNFPIFETNPPSVLETAELTVDLDLNIGTVSSVFDFTHTETPNDQTSWWDWSGKCDVPDGFDEPCPDIVEATTNLASSDTFMVGDDTYIFEVLGFCVSACGEDDIVPLSQFITFEDKINSAQLLARYTFDPGSMAPIPLPAAGWMLLAGVGGLAAMKRRKKAS